jgi:hypothetical protein
MAKGIGFGSRLAIGSGSGTVVGGIIDQIENEVSTEEVDTTLLGDKYKTFAPADVDPGELTFDIALDNGDTTNQTLVDLLDSGDVVEWHITYSNNVSPDSFNGWVKTLGRMISKRELLTRKVTIRLTGDPGMTGA